MESPVGNRAIPFLRPLLPFRSSVLKKVEWFRNHSKPRSSNSMTLMPSSITSHGLEGFAHSCTGRATPKTDFELRRYLQTGCSLTGVLRDVWHRQWATWNQTMSDRYPRKLPSASENECFTSSRDPQKKCYERRDMPSHKKLKKKLKSKTQNLKKCRTHFSQHPLTARTARCLLQQAELHTIDVPVT